MHTASHSLRLATHAIGQRSENAFHHREMLAIVVCLKERDTEVQFEQNATDRPYVTWLSPAQF